VITRGSVGAIKDLATYLLAYDEWKTVPVK